MIKWEGGSGFRRGGMAVLERTFCDLFKVLQESVEQRATC